MITTLTLVLLSLYLIVSFVTQVLWRNYKSHKFFQLKSPNLPVVPKPNIFHGHALNIIKPKKNWKIIEDLHKEHGPTFGYYMINRPWVSTTDLDLIKLIQVDAAYKHIDRPFFDLPITEFNHSLFQVNGDRWRQVRRVISPTLTNHRVKSDHVSSDIESVVDQLAASLERRAMKSNSTTAGGKQSRSFELEARNICERYSLAVIMLTSYKKSNIIDFDSDRDVWVDRMNQAQAQITNPLCYLSFAIPSLNSICEWALRFSAMGRVQREIVNLIEEATNLSQLALKQHGSNLVETKDKSKKHYLVDTFIEAFLDRKINHDNFVGSLFFLLIAGFMTTADTISCLLWQLAKNVDIQEKLRQTIIGEGIEADYVMWTINETIRYHPAVPLGVGRVLGEDIEINGQFLAKGTYVMPTIHGIHHDPNIWPEPERFNPERWRDQANFHPAAFMGFGLGPRNCVGGKLAIHEIKLVMKMLLTNYRVESCEKTPNQINFSSPGLVYTENDEPLVLRFTAIEQKHA